MAVETFAEAAKIGRLQRHGWFVLLPEIGMNNEGFRWTWMLHPPEHFCRRPAYWCPPNDKGDEDGS